MSRRKRKKPTAEQHECAGQNCTRLIATQFKFCRRCSGNQRPNVDAMSRRVPGSFGSGRA